MHESSLAKHILDLGLERARGARLRTVRGWVAETESLSPASLQLHFDLHARGTPAEGARLELRLIHVRAKCRACGEEFLPEHHLLLCPSCGATEADELGETGLKIESIEVDEQGG